MCHGSYEGVGRKKISRRPCVLIWKLMLLRCHRACWTTWQKPWRRWTEKKDVLWYLLLLCTWTHEQVLVRGLWEAVLGDSAQQMRPIIVFLATTLIACLTNSFAACLWVCCDTVGSCHCVLGQIFFVVVSVGSCPFRCLLCCSLDGKTQIWLGDCVLPFGCGVWQWSHS